MRKSLVALFVLFSSFTCFSQNFKIENNELVLDQPIVFKTGNAELLPQSEEVLLNIKLFLQGKTYISLLRIEGHTSSDGKASDNQTLSEQRALAVSQWLQKNGVDCKRLIAVGFGSTKPLVSETAPEDKAKNSRIVFAVASLRGHPIGGNPVDGGGKVVAGPCE